MSEPPGMPEPTEEPEGFQEAFQSARYVGSRLLSVHAHTLESAFRVGAVDVAVEAVTGLRGRVRWGDEHGVALRVSVRLSTQAPQDGGVEPFLLALERVLVYRGIPEGCSDDVLLRLADTLAVGHAWPLLRQDVIELTSRLALPPIVLPPSEAESQGQEPG